MQGAICGYERSVHYLPVVEEEEQPYIKHGDGDAIQEASGSPRSPLLIEEPSKTSRPESSPSEGRLKVRETLKLSFQFCILWVELISIGMKVELTLHSSLYV